MQLLDDYIKEMSSDVEFDDFSVKDTQMKLPAIKHKWVGRLMRHKRDHNTFKADRQKLVKAVATKIKKTSPYNLSDAAAEKAAYKHEDILKLTA